MLPSSRTTNSFCGKIHLIFEKSQDALAFVEKSELVSIIYVNDYVLQLCNGYTLVCKMLIDCDDKDENDIIKQTDQLRFRNGKYQRLLLGFSKSDIAELCRTGHGYLWYEISHTRCVESCGFMFSWIRPMQFSNPVVLDF